MGLFHLPLLQPPEGGACEWRLRLQGRHLGSSVTQAWRGQGRRCSRSREPSQGSHTHTQSSHCVCEGEAGAVPGPGAEAADRLTDVAVAVTTCYLGGRPRRFSTLSSASGSSLAHRPAPVSHRPLIPASSQVLRVGPGPGGHEHARTRGREDARTPL